MILEKMEADEKNPENEKDDDDSDQNSGTMIVDATCAPSQIKYPQDAALLNEARENTEKLIDTLHTPGEKKPRTYSQKAHKDYLALARTRKPGRKKIRKAIKKQLILNLSKLPIRGTARFAIIFPHLMDRAILK